MARWVLVLAALAGVGVVLIVRQPAPARRRPTPARLRAPATLRRLVVRVIGHSVQGRPLVARELGNPNAGRKILVVGCVHGDERAGISVVRRLERSRAPRTVDLWVLPDVNPDGAAARTRQNADGVDLNRNFPFHWRPLGRRGDQQYSGPRPLSEPETRALHTFLIRLRPAVTVWFHQPLGLVDESGGKLAIERRFAHVAGLPLRRLERYPGSITGWQNHVLHGATAFVVELGPRATGARAAGPGGARAWLSGEEVAQAVSAHGRRPPAH